ncbi:MAG: MarR family transcriptional regulator [Pseudomonadota bacterium]
MRHINENLAQFAPAFFGLSCARLVDQLVAEGAAYAEAAGVKAPVRSISSLMLLSEQALTVTELASALGISHVGAIKAIDGLIKADLVQRTQDPDDGRRKPLTLSKAGETAVEETRAFMEVARATYQALFEEIGTDAYRVISDLNEALDRRSFRLRLAEQAEMQQPS